MRFLDPVQEVPVTARAAGSLGEMSIRHLLGMQASRTPDAVAIAAPGRDPLTYRGLLEQIDDVTAALRNMGVGRDGRVALVLSQGAETAVASVAVAAAATCAPLNPAYRSAEHEFLLKHFHVGAVIVQSDLQSPVRAVAGRYGIPLIELTPLQGARAGGAFALRGPAWLGASLAEVPSGDPPRAKDVALVLSTSGTTSRPKTVPLTHENLCTSALNMGRSLELCQDDRCLNMMPLFHIHGFMVTLATLVSGGSVVCAQGGDIGRFFALLEEFIPTWYSAAPTIHQAVLSRAPHHRETTRRRALRFVRSSSSALPRRTAVELEALFGAPVIESYGMTEAAHQITCNPRLPRARKLGSVGLPAGPEVGVMDDAGNLLPTGERGELVIRGPSIMRGYEGDPDANAAAFTGEWLRTGDEGFIDEDGYVFLTGRLKEIIDRGGQKIAPAEVDEVLMDHPAVAQAVTFGMSHSTLGEDVAAAIVLRGETSATEGGIREFAAVRLAPYKVPRRIVFVREIPRGATGKLQRFGLADRLLRDGPDQRTVVHQPPTSTLEYELAGIWEEVLGVRPSGIDDDFFELGGHSLLAAEMLDRVEHMYGVRMPVSLLLEGATVDHLANVLATALLSETVSTNGSARLTQLKGGSKRPFVFLHGDWGGGGVYCRRLARFLGEDQPFYVLHPHGLYGERSPQSIEAMAVDHLEALLKVCPTGPYVLGGHCNGAVVAFEMARRLRAAGQAVDLLILSEPPFPRNRDLHLRLAYILVTGWGRVFGLNPDQRMALFARLKGWRQWLRRMGRRRPALEQNLGPPTANPPPSMSERLQDHWGQLWAHYDRAIKHYLPRRYTGRVAIIWGQQELEWRLQHRLDVADVAAAWRRLLPQAAMHVVPGHHVSMITSHADGLAECLKMCLDQA